MLPLWLETFYYCLVKILFAVIVADYLLSYSKRHGAEFIPTSAV